MIISCLLIVMIWVFIVVVLLISIQELQEKDFDGRIYYAANSSHRVHTYILKPGICQCYGIQNP